MASRRYAAALAILACVISAAARAEPLQLDGTFSQGGLVTGRTTPGAQVALDGKAIHVGPDGVFLLGFGRDAPASARLEVSPPSGTRIERTLDIAQRQYDIQRIDGLPPAQVTPPAEELERIRAEAAMVREARSHVRDETAFAKGFVWPAVGPISGVYGSQRILNGEPRRPHFGVDVAVPTGTPVVATADATVVLAHPGMYFPGGIVILDHGHGLTSTYMHLSAVHATTGQAVRQGERIGAVGATGRVTGPHLHWQFELRGMPLDAALIAGPMPAAGPSPASAGAAKATAPAASGSRTPAGR